MLKLSYTLRVSKFVYVLSAIGLASMIVACAGPEPELPAAQDSTESADDYAITEWIESAGIRVPRGFEVRVFAEGVGRGRHIAVRDNGDVFVRLREPRDGGGVAALRDEDGDGVADRIETFGPEGGTGIVIHDGQLFFSGRAEVFKVALPDGDELVPTAEIQSVVAGFPEQRSHTAKALAFDEKGYLYVNSGAPSNACQEESRTAGSPGLEPCPELERGGGIWRYPADAVGLDQMDGELFATGIRNAVGLGYSPALERVVAGSHGRDQLDTLWPDFFTAEQNAELPAEELLALEQGADYGWPYAYWDGEKNARMVSPEYGGDGQTEAEAGRFAAPAVALPAHWAPNAVVFHDGTSLPEHFKDGAFVAFHGSWNRAPLPQGGYNVVFVPMVDDALSSDWQVFAEGFSGHDELASPADAVHRPTGVAVGPDGSIYVSDSVEGRVWRIRYVG